MKKARTPIYGQKELKCSKCGRICTVDITSVAVVCDKCVTRACIEADATLKLELDKEDKYTKEDWIRIIKHKDEAYQARIEEKRNIDLDEVVKKRDKRKNKQKKFIETSIKKEKLKKESRKKKVNEEAA